MVGMVYLYISSGIGCEGNQDPQPVVITQVLQVKCMIIHPQKAQSQDMTALV